MWQLRNFASNQSKTLKALKIAICFSYQPQQQLQQKKLNVKIFSNLLDIDSLLTVALSIGFLHTFDELAFL